MAATETAVSNDRIATVLERLVENQPVAEMGYAHPKYQAHLRDMGYFDEFKPPLYQNGFSCPATGETKQTIARAAALKPGKYLGGHVTVFHDTRGGIHLSYKNGTPDERMRNLTLFSSFADLIDKITAEMPVPAVSPASS